MYVFIFLYNQCILSWYFIILSIIRQCEVELQHKLYDVMAQVHFSDFRSSEYYVIPSNL